MLRIVFKEVKFVVCALLCLLFTAGSPSFADTQYSQVVQDLNKLYKTDRKFAETLDKALANVVPPPNGCSEDPKDPGKKFCWEGKNFKDLLDFFEGWRSFVPNPGNGMLYYELFYNFCLNNDYALAFVEAEPGLGWTKKFVAERGKFMDSPKSVTPENMQQWKKALGSQWNDYVIPKGGYKTFNQFFTRKLRNPRPVADEDSVLAAPADTLVNMISANLTAETKIRTKYDETLNISQLLNASSFSGKFTGGTAVSCILLPTVYHHYHAPVRGRVVESKENVIGIFFGMGGHFDTFGNNGNIGGYKAAFGVFGIYHRGYFIIETEKYGYVGMVPVGLDDISSVKFEEKYRNVEKGKPVPVAKGDRLGHFAYGGSLVILLFEKGVFSGLSVLQGQNIGPLTEKSGN